MRKALVLCLLLWAVSASADLLPTQQYTTVVETATATSSQTDASLWTPASGMRLVIQGCVVSSTQAVQVELEVSDVDVVPPIYLESYGSVVIGGGMAPVYTSSANAVLTYSTTNVAHSPTHGSVSVMCYGYEALP